MARNKSNMDTPTPVSNIDTLTSQCDGTEAHGNIGGTNARVDTLMVVVIAETTDRKSRGLGGLAEIAERLMR